MQDATTEHPEGPKSTAPSQISRLAFRAPPFWPNNVELWISQLEAAFGLAEISRDETKFQATVLDGRPMGDQKPSTVLAAMQHQAGRNFSDTALKMMWTRRLPQDIRDALAASSETSLRSVKVENYRDIVNDLFLSYKALGCNMSLKIHFLHSQLDFFPDNLGAVSDEHEGREDVNDEESAGRPSTSTTDEKINEVEKMILANRRITVKEVAEDLNISIGSCHSIFMNDLGMRRVAAKFVPKLLNCDQKQHRMNIANEMLDSVRDDPNLLQRVITGDEAWVYGYDVETKAQSSQWKLPHEPRPKKARQVRSNVKVLLTVFFDFRGVVHHEFFPQAIRQKRPDLWKNKNWLLHHDNAPAHTSLLVRDLLAKNNTLMMPQPPYSPELAPCNFLLFPKLKRPMKGRRYATLDEIKTASKEELKKILKNDFLKCFEDWKNRWHKCIISHGDYFEGDKIGIHE
ncbi:hypothetical protein LAZ67_X002338 [Cordylochernes scorpioides]|uniref:Transposase n=1 Tax=Cordylochernes scorpioides TaxID=51811 RepID=A0ABY6LXE4_9ARAC|nr:hypothetical protein LAZ67_X002338 [Cordylochernes scorpioides]